jgi:hypothetical protein
MNDHVTSPVCSRLAARAARWIARWQRRLSGILQAGDTFADHAGWSVTPTGFGGRIYRDPRFGQLSVTRGPRTPHEMDPPAVIAPAAGSRRPTGYRASAGRQRPGPSGGIERRNR